MELAHRIEYLRKEHAELLAVANELDRVLGAADSGDFSTQQRVLSELRSMGHRFDGIVEHCHTDDRIVESTYHHYLSEEDRNVLAQDHLQLTKVLSEFREELRFATADRTATLVKPGIVLAQQLRAHVTRETGFLNKIAEERKGIVNSPPKRLTPRARGARKKVRAQPRRPMKHAPKPVPYTLEPHPEF